MKKLLSFRRLLSARTLCGLLVLVAMDSYGQVPTNDLCSGATVLTSGITCSNTGGTLRNATVSSPLLGTTCGTEGADVWYQFTANCKYPTITLSSVGSSITGAGGARIQLFTACGGSSLACVSGNTFATGLQYPTGLNVGTTYFFRVYSNTAAPTGANWGFNVCITDVNDDCATAVNLTSAASCSSTTGSLLYSTASSTSSSCGNASSADVWYKYTATSNYPTITLTTSGSSFKAAIPAIELLQGTCAGLTQVTCMNGTPVGGSIVMTPGFLTIGTTYYIRIFTNTATGLPTGSNWGFSICITDASASSPTLDYGKSYVNITKGSSGGTIEPGDILEIRATFVVKQNMAYSVSYSDVVPTNTTYIANSLRTLTNEGKIYQQFTDAASDDPGTISGTNISINLGSGATALAGGVLRNTSRPTNFGSTCIIIASYRVQVNPAAPFGTVINLGSGSISYKNQPAASVNTITFPIVNAVVYKNYGICANTVGSNGIISESGGTFGSGNLKDRGVSTKVPSNYTYTKFSNSNPQDYLYGVSNNTSSGGAAYSTNPNDPTPGNHVFNVWDIIGDHTGASNQFTGNPPADTTGGKTGGYMVVINAAFRTDTAFLDTVKNLCPNTYYEYSAWFRNICHICGADSMGTQPTQLSYIPTGPNDSSGVHPNLTFNINGYDYYTTGDMGYSGQWTKRGFTYLTGPAQTQMIISIRNNAPGGGGNDWAIDDIGVATCTPNLALTPSATTVSTCFGDTASFSATVTSFFNNYTEYIWERSTDGGATWTNTGISGSASPTLVGAQYVYTAAGPQVRGDSTTHNNIFRLRVASSSSNLSDPNCSFSGSRTIQVMVHNCMWILRTDITAVTGQLKNSYATISWQTVNENSGTTYEIEKSTDGTSFVKIGAVNGNAGNGIGSYSFDDPNALTGTTFYRIRVKEEAVAHLSKTIVLSPGALDFAIKNLVNPFSTSIQFDVLLPAAGDVTFTVFDNYGNKVKTYVLRQAIKGMNHVQIPDLMPLAAGFYTLRAEWQQQTISHRIVKSGH
jgi:hypothetical protein